MATFLQALSRAALARGVHEGLVTRRDACIQIQAQVRGSLARETFQRLQVTKASTRLQALIRQGTAQSKLEQLAVQRQYDYLIV